MEDLEILVRSALAELRPRLPSRTPGRAGNRDVTEALVERIRAISRMGQALLATAPRTDDPGTGAIAENRRRVADEVVDSYPFSGRVDGTRSWTVEGDDLVNEIILADGSEIVFRVAFEPGSDSVRLAHVPGEAVAPCPSA
ncbi:hypothetical protein LAZ40_09290 [Cereibacter sphaeroides]|uniref:hypothetical protein n=1 Tax=Cereibacter sphaeroides TaxID=1063 RepID=UPI001F26A269|nr:hypothetical protein [Cereibacter sphaeroides]MCE6959245.1 hypothetical protein [Cereibacter sphaeroides]MCE6972048.1 hypothetical protein [Cereibacter sphaeroides]